MTKHQAPGTVYGVILNDAASVQALGDLDAAPYKGAPKTPVLYIKPDNTRVAGGAVVTLPAGAQTVEVAATVGLVLGRATSRVGVADALACVGGLVLAADLSLPHASYYRPAIREKCFDGALPLSPVQPVRDLAGLELLTQIDGQEVERRSLSELLRSPAQLLAEISDWMTLQAGDVLLVGVRYQAPQARVGSRVRISADGLGSVEFSLAAGEGA
ncbi:MAG: fumarylacetoacetate hydrolase family protein [Comamonadaceae bacterium]|nr:fumarylacetoacetate hydrolase family protein [Comamonadaceae bacterium]